MTASSTRPIVRRTAARSARRSLVSAFTALVALVLSTGVALAYWSGQGSGGGQGTAGTLDPPTNVAASSAPGSSTVQVSWTGSTLSTGQPASGYYVTRTRTADGTSAAACGTSASTLAQGTSCTDASVADGTYRYAVTAVYASWTARSTSSTDVTLAADKTAPSVVSSERAAASPTNASSVSWTVTFSEPVTGVDSGDFALTPTGVTGTSVTGVTATSGAVYTVSASTGTGDGTVRLDVLDNGSIKDAAGNPLSGGTYTAGQSYTVDRTAPATSDNTASLGNGWKNTTQTVTLTANDAGPGVVRTYYTTNGSTPTTSSTVYSGGITLANDGQYTVKYFSVDAAGNVEAVRTAGTVIRIDKTAPAVTMTFPTGTVSGKTAWDAGCGTSKADICGTAVDAGSGLAALDLSVQQSGGKCLNKGGNYGTCPGTMALGATSPWSASADYAVGSYTVTLTSRDVLGNQATYTFTYTVT